MWLCRSTHGCVSEALSSSSTSSMSKGVVDAQTFERRLRPVYDALDARKYKAALKLCDGLLDKYPDSHLVTALKAISLQRQGKKDEASKLCDALLSQLPVQPKCLHLVQLVLKDLHRSADITRVYESAAQQEPSSVEWQEALFAAYAREGRFVKQQQVAMKLLKLSGGQENYTWWIVLSLMLQVRDAMKAALASGKAPLSEPTTQQLLQLAESMAARVAAKSGRVHNFEALLLWLDLQLARGQPGEALQVVEGSIGKTVVAQEQERGVLQADLRAAAGDKAGAADVLRRRLLNNLDDWSALQGYLDCMLPGTVSATHGPLHTSGLLRFDGSLTYLLQQHSGTAAAQAASNALTDTKANDKEQAVAAQSQQGKLQECQELVSQLVQASEAAQAADSGNSKRVFLRAPHLAKVELAHRPLLLQQQQVPGTAVSDTDALQRSLAQAIYTYWQKAGHMVSCAADLRSYTIQLAGSSHAAWLWQQLGGDKLLDPSMGPETGTHNGSGEGSGNGNGNGNGSTQPQQAVIDELRRKVCALQLGADMQQPELVDSMSAVRHAVALMQLYAASQPLYQGVDERARGPADELPCLAAAALMEAACKASSPAACTQLMLLAITACEAAVATRPFASAARLALAALHTLLGNAASVATHIQALDIKNIQLDSLAGHHLLPSLAATEPLSGHLQLQVEGGGKTQLSPLARLLHDTNALFNEHARDAGDTLELAYKHGTYTKVLEFVSFKERLNASHTRAVVRLESLAASLRASVAASCSSTAGSQPSSLANAIASAASAALTLRPLPWGDLPAQLRFNEDAATRPGWYPPVAGAVGLTATAWWEQRAAAAGTARGMGAWWITPGATESSYPAAVTLRAQQLASVRARWHQMHLLLYVIAGLGAWQQVPPDTGLLTEPIPALIALAQALGCASDQSIDTWLQQQAEAVSKTVEPAASSTHQLLQVLGCAVLAAGVQLATFHSALHQDSSDEATLPVFQARLKAAVKVLQHTADRLSAAIKQCVSESGTSEGEAGRCLLPGGPLLAAAALLTEPVAWLMAIMEAASHTMKAPRKGKKGGPDAGGGHAALSQALSTCLSEAASTCSTCLGTLCETLQATCAHMRVLTQQEAAEKLLHDSLEGDVSSLWAWQAKASGFDAPEIVTKLAVAQSTSATAVHTIAVGLKQRAHRLVGHTT